MANTQLSLLLLAGFIMAAPVGSADYPPSQCLGRERGDTATFGFALAMNDRVLAIGDPLANRVTLYGREGARWTRRVAIVPPSGSSTAGAGEGFGRSLALDDSLLLIGAHSEQIPGVANRTGADPATFNSALFTAHIRPDGSAGAVRPVPLGDADDGFVSFGHSVALDGRRAAVGLIDRTVERAGRGSVALLDLASGTAAWLEVPDQAVAMSFGGAVAVSGTVLAASAPFARSGAPIWVRSPPGHGRWLQAASEGAPTDARYLVDTLVVTPRLVLAGGRPIWVAPISAGKLGVFHRMPGSENRLSAAAAFGDRIALLDRPPPQVEDQGAAPEPPLLRQYRLGPSGLAAEGPPLLVRSIDPAARRRSLAMTADWIAVAAPTGNAACSIVLLDMVSRKSRGNDHE